MAFVCSKLGEGYTEECYFVLCLFVHTVAILSVLFCAICSLLMSLSNTSGDHMVEAYSSMGLVMALYVASIVSFCFRHRVTIPQFFISPHIAFLYR